MAEPTTKAAFWTRRRRLWALAVVAALALAAAAGHWLPDWGLRYGVLRSLRDLGWSRVSVSAADLSLFNGAIVVRQVAAGEELGRALGIDGLDLRFRWKPLFSRRLSVERLDLDGVDVDIRREGGGLVVNGLPLAVAGGGGGGSDWSYDVTALTLVNSRLHFADGITAVDVEVERLELDDLKSWEPSQPARFRLNGRINGAPFRLEGTATPFAGQPRFAVRLDIERFDLAGLAEAVRRAGLGALTGRVSARVAIDGGADGGIGLAGTVALDNGSWSDGATRVAAADLKMTLDGARWENGAVTAAGMAAARGLRIDDGGVAIADETAQLVARSLRYDVARRLLSWDGTLHAERQGLTAGEVRIDHATLDWTGASRFDFAAAGGFVHAEGKAELGDSRLGIGRLAIEARRAVAEGVFEHTLPDGMLPPLAGRMDLAAEQVWVREAATDWLHADRIEAADVRLAHGSAAAVGRVEARQLAVLARHGRGGFPWRLEARQAVLERATLAADGGGSAADLSLSGMLARVTRTKAGFLGLAELSGDGDAAAGNRAAIALGRLRLGGDSRVEFEDRSLPEPVRLRADGVEVAVGDLDSARPDRDSPFTAKGRIGSGQIAAQGRVRPFAAVPGGEVKGSVRALDLPPLSPYVANSLGVLLHTGLLDAEVALSANQGKLDGGLQLDLKELFVAEPEQGSKLAKTADMPVETVLDLLRDSDNRIKLSIPVRGDLSNPDFDISDAVGQAVGGALRSTVFTTLKVAFPLAGLISLVIDDSESRRLALEPLAFAPGAEALGERERGRLDAVAALMARRPNLKLTLCGVATEAGDGPALAERRRQAEQGLLGRLHRIIGSGARPQPGQLADHDGLSQLAEARAQAAKSYLVDQRGIDAGRLFTCRPRVEAEANAAPRVDLVL